MILKGFSPIFCFVFLYCYSLAKTEDLNSDKATPYQVQDHFVVLYKVLIPGLDRYVICCSIMFYVFVPVAENHYDRSVGIELALYLRGHRLERLPRSDQDSKISNDCSFAKHLIFRNGSHGIFLNRPVCLGRRSTPKNPSCKMY